MKRMCFEKLSKFYSTALPMIGGSGGALSNISSADVFKTIILASLGAIIGYFIKLGLDQLLNKIKKK